MNNVSRLPAPEIDRKAQAVAEISQLYAQLEEATREREDQARIILRQQDRIEMLENDLRDQKQRAQICERKLIRLATNQRNISRIAQDGDEIMRSIQEWQETEAAPKGDGDVGEILERCPTATLETIPPKNAI